jgi:hypothetical protein
LVAKRGTRAGKMVVGKLWLTSTSQSDVSPTTGERPPQTEQLSAIPLYGSLEMDLEAVGAPIKRHDANAPDPDSRDPIRPGVLVHLVGWEPKYPENTPVLTIGTVSNLRTGKIWVDGPGMGLWVHQLGPSGFAGRWDAWGIVSDGSGYFCASPIRE